jgi:hypothetical protein
VVIAAVGIGVTVIANLHKRIRNLDKSRSHLAAQYHELAATNNSLLAIDAAQNDELNRLRHQNLEVLRLRNQLTQAHEQLAVATAANPTPRAEDPNGTEGYMAREQLKFVGFDTPENAFQSMYWAAANGDYTNWLASLSPDSQKEELADPGSSERFRGSASRLTGIKVLASKSVGNDRVELKVQMESENASALFIYPMVLTGNQWRMGGDIHAYTRAWDTHPQAWESAFNTQ